MKPPRLEWKLNSPGFWSCGRLRITLNAKTYKVYWISENYSKTNRFIMSGDRAKRFRSLEKAKMAAEQVGFLK